MRPLDGEPLGELPSHGESCWGCGLAHPSGLRMRFVDDGSVTRAVVTLTDASELDGEVRASVVLGMMEEALSYAGHARLGGVVLSDGKFELFARGVRAGVPLVVEAWPGRRSGLGFFFYARVLQEDVERAHVETWLASKPEALARRAATEE